MKKYDRRFFNRSIENVLKTSRQKIQLNFDRDTTEYPLQDYAFPDAFSTNGNFFIGS